jgi:flagellar biosynthetic protein FliR
VPENPFAFTPQQAAGFILILMRIVGLFWVAPVFSSRTIPRMVKASWALLFAFLLFAVVPLPADIPTAGALFGLAIVRELFVGFVLGFAVFLLFAGIQLAGQVVDIQMGLGMVNVIDPISSTQVSVMGQFFYVVATLVFLLVDGHHVLLRALADSFTIIPLGQAHFTGTVAGLMNNQFTSIFWVAFRVGAPMIGTLFLTNLALGVLSRTVPQMNVFIVGMPLNIAVGFAVVAISMGFYVYVLQGLFRGLPHDLGLLIHAMR